MQVSIKWLKDYIDFAESAEELAEKLTRAGVPVENVIRADKGLDKVVTGRIDEIIPHPDSDHMFICTVNVGDEKPLTIVTGAQNVRQGDIVPVALVGADLPCGKKIAKSKLRGVASAGMLCSADEIKIDTTNLPDEQINGIYILEADTPVGIPAAQALGLDDAVLEFELTANRADCFSVIGIVREIAAITGNQFKWPEIRVREDDGAKAADMIKISIEDPDLCSRFSARVLNNVKIGPSPAWMRTRLEGAGVRSINNVVDVTNFVMIELGQPMHAYDYDEIVGQSLIARRAKAGEELHTLDDSSRLAKGGELVIADAVKAAGLAGVMGGLETEITGKTTSVVLESASFFGPSIRRTSRSVGLHSEASGRFERGIDIEHTIRALDRAAQLLQDMGACTVAQGVIDVYPMPKPQPVVPFTAEQINKRLGTDIPAEEILRILASLGIAVRDLGSGNYEAVSPTWRKDIALMDDLSEEIARIFSYDNICATLPKGGVMLARQSEEQDLIDKITEILVAQGMFETRSFSFQHPDMCDKLNIPEDSILRTMIPIMNPLSEDYPNIRTCILTTLFETVLRNFSRKNEDVRVFEIGPVFFPKALPVTELPDQKMKAAGVIAGHRYPQNWTDNNEMVDFYDAKGIVESLLEAIGIRDCSVEAGEHFCLHPGKTAVFKKGREVIATVGEVHPQVMENLGTKKTMYMFVLADIKTLLKYCGRRVKFTPLPRYPAVERDLALTVADDVPAGMISRTIKKQGGKYLQSVNLFDLYTGKQLGEGKKSLAFSLKFRAADRTLTDEEADVAFNAIVEAVAESFGAELRK